MDDYTLRQQLTRARNDKHLLQEGLIGNGLSEWEREEMLKALEQQIVNLIYMRELLIRTLCRYFGDWDDRKQYVYKLNDAASDHYCNVLAVRNSMQHERVLHQELADEEIKRNLPPHS